MFGYTRLSYISCGNGIRMFSTSAARLEDKSAIVENIEKSPRKLQTIDDLMSTASESSQKRWLMKLKWVDRLVKRFFFLKLLPGQRLQSEHKRMLDAAALRLYRNCSNDYQYLKLIDKFGMHDNIYTWWKLTLLHVWMLSVRLHTSLDMHAYHRLKQTILRELWDDWDKRLKVVKEEIDLKVLAREWAKRLHGLYIQTLLELDEGFLDSDAVLAGSIWRCFYQGNDAIDATHLNAVVLYIRSTMAYLDTLDVESILVNGVQEWKTVYVDQTTRISVPQQQHQRAVQG